MRRDETLNSIKKSLILRRKLSKTRITFCGHHNLLILSHSLFAICSTPRSYDHSSSFAYGSGSEDYDEGSMPHPSSSYSHRYEENLSFSASTLHGSYEGSDVIYSLGSSLNSYDHSASFNTYSSKHEHSYSYSYSAKESGSCNVVCLEGVLVLLLLEESEVGSTFPTVLRFNSKSSRGT